MPFSGDTNFNALVDAKVQSRIIDAISNADPIIAIALTDVQKFTGNPMKKAIQTAHNSTGAFYTSGLGTDRPRVKQDLNRALEVLPTHYSINVTVDGMEKDSAEQTDNKSADLWLSSIDQAKLGLIDDVTTALYSDGSSNQFYGLAYVADDGTNVSSYLGLTRSGTSVVDGVYNATGAAFDITVIDDAIQSATHGNKKPNVIITDKSTYSDIERVVAAAWTGNQYNPVVTVDRFGVRKQGDAFGNTVGQYGFEGIVYKGCVVLQSDYVTAGRVYGFRLDDFSFYGLRSTLPGYTEMSMSSTKTLADSTVDSQKMKPAYGFAIKPMGAEFQNQYGLYADLIMQGNLFVQNPRNTFQIRFS